MSTHKTDVDMLRKSFKEGAAMVRDALSMPSDPDLANYQKLSEQDFTNMLGKFGSEQVIDYIKDMEVRHMGLNKKGKK